MRLLLAGHPIARRIRKTPTVRALIYGVVAAFFATACGPHKVSKFYPEIIPKGDEASLAINPAGKQTVNVTYMGCGNLFLEKEGTTIMFDPFFSVQGMLRMAGKVRTRPDLYALWKSNLQHHVSRSTVHVALVSHTHYDHVMDLPTLLHDKYFPRMEVVYGNTYLPKMLTNFAKERVRMESFTDDQVVNSPDDQGYTWMSVNENIRFLPIRSTHAPHTRKKLFMSKPLKPDYFAKHLVWPGDKVGAFKWTVGDSYSFLVDFMGADTLRVFVQTSASQHPAGMPPAEVIKAKKVDVAIFCYASSMNVSNFPNAYVDYMKPSKVMFVHWEDFFREARSEKDFKLVRGTNPRKVRRRVELMGKKKEYFIMPRPGTKVVVRY